MNKSDIISWLDKYGIKKYTINDDLTVDVAEYVNLVLFRINKIHIQFNKVNGYFNCSNNQLTSLEGCPKIVNGRFNCSYNKLTSLKYLPDVIEGYLWCDYNLKDSVEYKAYELMKALRK